MLTLTMKARGAKARRVPVATLAKASEALREWIDNNGFGGSAIQHPLAGGDVHDDAGTLIARVSYNGRIWTPDGKPLDGMDSAAWVAACTSGGTP